MQFSAQMHRAPDRARRAGAAPRQRADRARLLQPRARARRGQRARAHFGAATGPAQRACGVSCCAARSRARWLATVSAWPVDRAAPHAPASAAPSSRVVVRVPEPPQAAWRTEVARRTCRPTSRPAPSNRLPPNRGPRSGPGRRTLAARVTAPASGAVPSGPRTVRFNPYPANVSIGVDGSAPRAFGPSFREVRSSRARTAFKFVGAHDCCIEPNEVSVKVPPGEGAFVVAPRLKSSSGRSLRCRPTRRPT